MQKHESKNSYTLISFSHGSWVHVLSRQDQICVHKKQSEKLNIITKDKINSIEANMRRKDKNDHPASFINFESWNFSLKRELIVYSLNGADLRESSTEPGLHNDGN